MLFDARSIPRDITLETEVCIVGAGAAGISLALALAGAAFRVCLLESGGFEPDEETQKLARGRVYGRSYFRLDEARSRGFGGSTRCWDGICRPLDPLDFEARDWVPHSGWPLDAAQLRPYYERAQELCGLEDFDYSAARWARPDMPALALGASGLETRVFQIAPRRFGEAYRQAVTRAPNLDTYLFANAVDLEADRDGGSVRRLRVACLGGNGFSVRARHFVLATGGIENARLLLASRGVREQGLGNQHDLVGRFFMEHPHLLAGVLLPSGTELPLGLYWPRPQGRVRVVGYWTASAAVQRRERMLSFSTFLSQELDLPHFEQDLGRAVHEMDRPGGAAPGRALLLANASEQAPNPASRVRLSDERDALGLPRVQLEWRLSPLDQRSLRRGHELLGQAVGRAALGRFQLTLSEDDLRWPPELQGGRHHMGTTRMHTDPRQGVVDADCRVHGLANLYVAGSSVFPTSGSASPTLSLVALALRLADRLREELS